jgi:hypothetical protein
MRKKQRQKYKVSISKIGIMKIIALVILLSGIGGLTQMYLGISVAPLIATYLICIAILSYFSPKIEFWMCSVAQNLVGKEHFKIKCQKK